MRFIFGVRNVCLVVAALLVVVLAPTRGDASALLTWSQIQALDPTKTDLSDALLVFDGSGALVYELLLGETSGATGFALNGDIATTSGGGLAGPEDPSAVYYFTDPFLAEVGQFGNATTLIEGGPTGAFSDIFGVAGIAGPVLAFNSDTDTAPAEFGGQGTIFLPEGNGVFDATMYLNADARGSGWTAIFASDPESVPEPTTLVLLGTGVAALRLRRRFSR